MPDPKSPAHTRECKSMLECDGVIYDGWLAMGCRCPCHEPDPVEVDDGQP